jgi:hypothetical protein
VVGGNFKRNVGIVKQKRGDEGVVRIVVEKDLRVVF